MSYICYSPVDQVYLVRQALMTSLPDGYSDPAESQRQVREITHPGRILLVDDDPKFQQILQAFLELKGFHVIAVNSGEAALEQLTQSDVKVVLLDMKMPGMDGLLTLKHIRMSHPNLPVIFATQMDEEETMGEAGILGVNNYLIKPFSFELLEAILRAKIFT